MAAEPTSFHDSHWAAVTALGLVFGQLEGDASADAVIIGAGFTGLSTALHLAERGVSVVVLEAATPGYGASGRNNGQVIPTLSRMDPDDMVAKHGAAGDRLADLVRDSADILFALVRRHGLNAEAEQTGWVQPAHTPGRLKVAENRVRQWQKRGAPVAMLTKDEVSAITGSQIWHGGWGNATGGHINPLALVRELARKVTELGGRIFSHSPAASYERQGDKWVVTTPRGCVRATSLVLATHSYTAEFSQDLQPELAREVVPVLSWQMATQALGHNLRASIIPARQAVSDTHGDLYFMRYDARHQLVTGGALVVAAGGAARLKARIRERLLRIFPQMLDVTFSHVWNGNIAMTDDYAPRIHQLGPNAYAWAGCNGRGVALSIALGREFAAVITGTSPGELALPFTAVKPLPLHGILRRVAPLMLMEYRRRDAREI